MLRNWNFIIRVEGADLSFKGKGIDSCVSLRCAADLLP